MTIPFVDLKAQYQSLKPQIDFAIQKVISETIFIGGKYVKDFEHAFAEAYGVKHCISVANGTDAIYITMKMLGIGSGDEVITVANSWISTSETITQAGATPVFIDVDKYHTIDVSRIEEHITPRTKAIIPVHLYGQAADILRITAVAEKHNIPVIEDCAQSHFTAVGGKFVGTFGAAGTFSFYPGKNLGAYGDAGCIVTNDDRLAEKMRMYANHGALKKHHHLIEGINSRLDSLQAAILSTKLPYIKQWNELRAKHATRYTQLLGEVSQVELPEVRENTNHTFHLYVIQCDKRDELKKYLEANGIESNIHYPTAIPFQPCYSYMKHVPGDFPQAFRNQSRILSLPMFPELTNEQIEYVTATIKTFFS